MLVPEKESRRGRPRYGTEKEKFVKFSCTLPPDIYARLEKFCADDERSKAWAISKALIPWLEERGY